MPNVTIRVSLKNSEGCKIVVKIGGKMLDFANSGTKTENLPPKAYIALIAGFLDPAAENPSAVIEFKQGASILNSITINEGSFIKPLKVTLT
jgi:hypothetical protein